MNEKVYYCEEDCGTRVDQNGGTCLRCWEAITGRTATGEDVLTIDKNRGI